MVTQIFGRIFPKTLTLTATYSRSLSTTSFLRRLRPLSSTTITSRRVLLPPSLSSLSTRTFFHFSLGLGPSPNHFALKSRNGCNYFRRLVIMQSSYIDQKRDLLKGEREPTMDEIMDSYVKTIAELVGSEDEARMMVYSGRKIAKHKYAFGTLLSGELGFRVEALPGVVMILPGDPFAGIENIDEIPMDELEAIVEMFTSIGDPLEPY